MTALSQKNHLPSKGGRLACLALRRAIPTVLLALLALAGRGQTVWEEPLKAYTAGYLKVRKVELTPEKTALHLQYSALPGNWFRISKDSYLQTDGKQYGITGSDSIQLGDQSVMGKSGRQDFVLYFKPLPAGTREFDFLEGLNDDDFKVFGIHNKDYVFPPAPVPAEYQADQAREDTLEDLRYSPRPATIHFKALNYRKGMRTTIKVQYVDLKNPARPVDAECRLNDEGLAELSLPIGVPQMVEATIFNTPGWSANYLYLAPGKEVTVLVDMMRDDIGRGDSKFVGFKGYHAKLAWEYYAAATDSNKGSNYTFNQQADIKDMPSLLNYMEGRKAFLEEWKRRAPFAEDTKQVVLQNGNMPTFMTTPALDSLTSTEAFRNYLLSKQTEPLRSRKTYLNYFFVYSSRYYAFADARGISADLARYCHYLPKALDGQDMAKPLIEDSALSALYDKYVAEYRATVAANKQGLAENIHYLDMTEVAPQDILETILGKYRGKTILIDLWATWCGPCLYGHRIMAPLKEELKDKPIQYIYISPPSSPYQEWKNAIKEISGEHYYVTDAQYNEILRHYQSNGIPTYAIYNANGKQTYTVSGVPGIEVFRKELEKALQNQEQ